MSALPSLYRAKAVKVTGRQLQAFVPQVFGDTPITIDSFLGDIPSSAGMGWVFFQGGDAAFPVWSSGFSGNGNGGDTESWADEIEDLQEADVALDARLDALEAGGGGGTGADEVWVGPTQPSDPAIELWYDTDAPSASSVDRWNSAWGIIAVSTFIPPYAPHIVTTTEAITNALTASLITGRRYRIHLQIRAISNVSGANQLSFYLSDNGSQIRGWAYGGDPYVWSQGAYQGLNYEWHYLGDNTSHSFVAWVAPGASMNLFTDYGLWYIEDAGPVAPAAVSPPAGLPAVVAAGNAIGIVAQLSPVGTGTQLTLTSSGVDVTTSVVFTPQIGRRYRLTASIRAISAGGSSFYLKWMDGSADILPGVLSPPGGEFYFARVGAAGESGYAGYVGHWTMEGDGVTRTWKIRGVATATTGANPVIFHSEGARYYIEDVGPNSTPALPFPETPPAWTPIVPLNNWTVPGVSEIQPGVRKIGDMVYLKGSLMGGSTPPVLGQSAFQLPPGFYNTILTRVSLNGFLSNGNTFACRVDLISSGAFVPTNIGGGAVGAGTFLQLNGVSWPVGVS